VSVFIVNPNGFDVIRWTGQMVLSLSAYGNIPRLDNAALWRHWANTVVILPAIAAVGAPRPDNFEHWEAWAAAFNQSIRVLE